jgi:hypothetical protein
MKAKAKSNNKRSNKNTPKVAARKPLLFGKFTVASVARRLGKAGLMPSAAHKAIVSMQKSNKSKIGAIRTWVQAGRHGLRGDPATLSKAQLAQLKKAAA